MRMWALAAVAVVATGAFAGDPPNRPNVVVILSDDMGYSDLGCYGGEIATPHLDALAAGGLRFTQFYNCARCCPTRAGLLTGLYPHQAGVGHMMDDKDKPGYRGDLNRNCATLAEALKPAGYHAYAVGKWHVTRHAKPEGPKHNWPTHRGFDRFYGTIHGAGSYYDPSSLVRDDTPISAYADPEYRPERYYYTDAISDHAVRFVRDHAATHTASPFVMYVAYTAAHWPMHAFEEDVAKYRGKYDGGYAPAREARFRRLKSLGLTDPAWPLAPPAEDWNAVADKAWEARCMEVYAAMVERMDRGVGRIVAALRETGRLDNTLILFLQDNGGCAEATGRAGDTPRADRPTLPPMRPEAFPKSGSRPAQTRDGWPVLGGRKVLPGPPDTYIAYGRGWANVSNTPFREYKHWVHEGGIATPLIAHWPAGIAARGELRRQPGHVIDVMPTLVDVAGAKHPVGQRPLAGTSLVPAFAGAPLPPRTIFWEHEGNRAARSGDWKLVAKGPAGKWELYDLAKDRTETRDLAGEQPAKLKELVAAWEAWAKRSDVLPWISTPAYGEPAPARPKGKAKAKGKGG